MSETPKDTTRRQTPSQLVRARQNGPAIRSLREKDGWTQTALAKAVGIRQATLSEIEQEASGTRITTLNKIARALCVPVGAIMREKADDAA